MNGSLILTVHVIANRTNNFLSLAAQRKPNRLRMKANRNRWGNGNFVSILCPNLSDRTCFYVCADHRVYAANRICQFGLERIWSDRCTTQVPPGDAIEALIRGIADPKGASETRIVRKRYFESIRRQLCYLPVCRPAQPSLLQIHLCTISSMEISCDTKAVSRHKG